MAVRLGLAALLLERAAERVVRVVVGRLELLDDRPELRLGLLPAGEPEVGDAERLADRGLPWLELLRLLERHGRLGGHSLAEPLLAFTEVVVRVAHSSSLAQIREVLAHQVNGLGQVAGAPYLDSRHLRAGVDRVPEDMLQLVGRVAGKRVEETRARARRPARAAAARHRERAIRAVEAAPRARTARGRPRAKTLSAATTRYGGVACARSTASAEPWPGGWRTKRMS